MFIMKPLGIGDYVEISGNLPNSTYPTYLTNGTYATGARVNYPPTNKEYEALQAVTPADPDPGGANNSNGYWVEIGYNNFYRPFDNSIGTQGSVGLGESIYYLLRPRYEIDTVALFAAVGSAVTVRLIRISNDEVEWGQTQIITNPLLIQGYGYGFAPEDARLDEIHAAKALFTGIPFVLGRHRVRIIIDPNDDIDVASVGQVCLGFGIEVGETLENASSTLNDYSRKEVNEFGEVEIIRRGYTHTIEYPVVIPSVQHAYLDRILVALRNQFCVAFPTYAVSQPTMDRVSLLNYGFLSEYSASFRSEGNTYANITIEGVS